MNLSDAISLLPEIADLEHPLIEQARIAARWPASETGAFTAADWSGLITWKQEKAIHSIANDKRINAIDLSLKLFRVRLDRLSRGWASDNSAP